MALPLLGWLPGVGSLESLAGRVAGYVFTNLCGLPAPAAHVRGARHKAQRQTCSPCAGAGCPFRCDGSEREKWRTTRVFDVRKFILGGGNSAAGANSDSRRRPAARSDLRGAKVSQSITIDPPWAHARASVALICPIGRFRREE